MSKLTREHYSQIVKLSGDGIFELDVTGRIVSVNPRGLAMLESGQQHDIVDRHLFERVSPSTQTKVREAIDSAVLGRHGRLQCNVVTLSGNTRIWAVTLCPLVHKTDQSIRSLLALCQDITENLHAEQALHLINEGLASHLQMDQWGGAAFARHAGLQQNTINTMHREVGDIAEAARNLAEQARADAEKVALQAQKGEAVSQLIAGLAHDFNNMLQTAVAAISVVTDAPKNLTPLQNKLLARSQEALQHAATSARRLLAFSRRQPSRFEPLDLREVAIATAELVRQALKPDIKLMLKKSTLPLVIQGDSNVVAQAVMNLCINARDACQDCGQITVSFSEGVIDQAWATPTRAAGRYAVLSVADTGMGMDQPTLARLFEPYFTTKPEGQGSGLGLAQVYGLMRHCGGFIDVDTAVGAGTVMSLWFPRFEGSAMAPVAAISQCRNVSEH